jgi:hypothetical protein
VIGRSSVARSLDGRSAVDSPCEEVLVGSFGVSPSGRFVVGQSVVDWPLGRLSEVGMSSGAFSTC